MPDFLVLGEALILPISPTDLAQEIKMIAR